MSEQADSQWLVDMYDEHGSTLHRLTVLLGAEAESGHIVRAALLALSRRSHRLVDPLERVEFVHEQVVHQARSARGNGPLFFPRVEDANQQRFLDALASLPVKQAEIVVVSHYLATFGPELAGVMRMTVRSANRLLEQALVAIRAEVFPATMEPAVLEAVSQSVTAALRASARMVTPPGTETLKADLVTYREAIRNRVRFWLAIPLIAASLVVGVWVVQAGDHPDPVTPSPTQAAASPSPEASRSLPVRIQALPIYYVGRSDHKLYRELRDLSSSDVVRAGVEGVLGLAPKDPDYRSLWSAGAVNSVSISHDIAVVDLDASAYENISSVEDARLAAMQVVYTMSDLAGNPHLAVTFKKDGGAPPPVFAALGNVQRAGLAPMPSLWITSPRNLQSQPAGQVLIAGLVKPGQPVPHVVITQGGHEIAAKDAAVSKKPNAEGWNVWTLSLDLVPGDYVVRAVAGDNSTEDTKSFTVE